MNNWQLTDARMTLTSGAVSFTMINVPGSSFMIGETPVTQELWEAVMDDNPSEFKGNPKNPVETVSCKKALEFIERLNEQIPLGFRLPTVREWEFAAKGGSKSKGYKYPGSNVLDEVCWYLYNSGKHTHPVKTKLPNEIGLYDMLGNVMEWTSDEIEVLDIVDQETRDLILPPDPNRKHMENYLKGGSCMNGKYTNTIEFTKIFEPWYYNFHIGFRLALTPDLSCSPAGESCHIE